MRGRGRVGGLFHRRKPAEPELARAARRAAGFFPSRSSASAIRARERLGQCGAGQDGLDRHRAPRLEDPKARGLFRLAAEDEPQSVRVDRRRIGRAAGDELEGAQVRSRGDEPGEKLLGGSRVADLREPRQHVEPAAPGAAVVVRPDGAGQVLESRGGAIAPHDDVRVVDGPPSRARIVEDRRRGQERHGGAGFLERRVRRRAHECEVGVVARRTGRPRATGRRPASRRRARPECPSRPRAPRPGLGRARPECSERGRRASEEASRPGL